MKTDQYGQIIYNESDLVSMIMRDATVESLNGMLVEPGVTLETASAYLEQVPELVEYAFTDMTVEEFDAMKQNSWHMPDDPRLSRGRPGFNSPSGRKYFILIFKSLELRVYDSVRGCFNVNFK